MYRAIVSLLAFTLSVFASPIEPRAVSSTLYDDLVLYTKYSSAAYMCPCPKPLGNVLVQTYDESDTDTQAFIARDDNRKEIILAFRGTFSLEDAITDIQIIQSPLESYGVKSGSGAWVHTGFLDAFNSIASDMVYNIRKQVKMYPDYTLISTGHSLGGALASLGGLSLKSNFPNSTVRMFTFGQPRTGNAAYAQLVEDVVGTSNIYRAVHTSDGVPTLIPQWIGYKHHGTEYWNFQDPAKPSNVKQCAGSEDPTCSDSIFTGGINIPHAVYFGQVMVITPILCT